MTNLMEINGFFSKLSSGPYISPISPLYLPYISPISPGAGFFSKLS